MSGKNLLVKTHKLISELDYTNPVVRERFDVWKQNIGTMQERYDKLVDLLKFSQAGIKDKKAALKVKKKGKKKEVLKNKK